MVRSDISKPATVAKQSTEEHPFLGRRFFIMQQLDYNSDPRKTTLARASTIYKRQTRPLVREGAPQNKTVGLDTKIY
jgi:hypothetical protein